MEDGRLEINAMSAKDLKNVNLISNMRPYAVVSISGDSGASQEQRTAVDRSGNANPTWNFPLKFAVEESAARNNRLGVTIWMRCERTLGDKDIGEVYVPLSELIGPAKDGELLQSDTYQVQRPGKPNKGELNFSYMWWPAMSQEPVTAYPAQVGPSPVSAPPATGCPYQYPPPQPGSVYPLPPSVNGYPPVQQPPPTGYPYQYPPPQPGSVYPLPPPVNGYPPVQQPPKKNWLAKLVCVELVKLCLGYGIADGFGSDPGVL